MLFFGIKAMMSGLLIAAVSSLARRYPALGGLVASLPLISVMGMIWLWLETRDPVRMATHAEATFWYVLPSLPMFLLIHALLRQGTPFYVALAGGCALTVLLYLLTASLGARFGLDV